MYYKTLCVLFHLLLHFLKLPNGCKNVPFLWLFVSILIQSLYRALKGKHKGAYHEKQTQVSEDSHLKMFEMIQGSKLSHFRRF